MEKKSALIVGATGLIGQQLLNHLLNGNNYETVTALVRRPLDFQHPKLKEMVIDFDELSDYQTNYKVNDVFCCLGTTIKKAKTKSAMKKVDVEYPLTLAKLSKEMGAEKFLVVSSIGADPNSRVWYSKMKGTLEEELKKVGFQSLFIFRPSLLLGERNEFRVGESFASYLSPAVSPLFLGKLTKYKPIQALSVAIAMAVTANTNLDGTHYFYYDQIVKQADGEAIK